MALFSSHIMSTLKETILLLKLKSRDTESFGQVYDLFVEKIFRFVYLKVSSREDAEDITSEVFLRAWQYLGEQKKIDNLNAFLYQIARNLVVDFYRKRVQQPLPMINEEQLEAVPDLDNNIFKKIDDELNHNNLTKVLSQLKDEYKEIIILRFIEEYSVEETAKIIGKTKSNVRVLSHRALQKVEQIINSDPNIPNASE